MIDSGVLYTILQAGVLAFVIPVVFIAAWKLRTRKSLIPCLIGAVTFVVFAKGLEMIPHTIFVITDNPISRVVTGNVVIYAIYGGLMAGLFEEIGRYIAFKYFLKKYTVKQTAVSYGLGHGGIECMLVLGVGYIQYFFYGQLLNNGALKKMIADNSGNKQVTNSLNSLVDSLQSISRTTCYIAIWERAAALLLQVALSILVFQAVYVAGKTYMLWVAVVLHALADFPAAFYQAGALGVVPTELLITVFSVIIFFIALFIYQNMDIKDEEEIRKKEEAHALHQIANQSLKK